MSAVETEDQEYDVYSSQCPSRPTLDHITGRWGMLALGALADGPMRFNALARRVEGVSQKMLAQALHALEHDGLILRDVQTTNRLHVEYSLTPLGRELAGKVLELIGLLEHRMPDILAARERADSVR
ncbi:winged helix-turn-helix transcriptional regulator [Amycolatopsis pithecellobii]|uniref:Transcriptional regulator n=1 Tax=Amycolatopsis pithecellobii TaxID=664692 RepID=A0A6N7Z5M9_9PSEU|nr:helix-turn-helix domain-containing protein [Amycolatopsis pithecellobii]MTD56979.1 transcriptional regulator [Amycolatopsis pithecellobii]